MPSPLSFEETGIILCTLTLYIVDFDSDFCRYKMALLSGRLHPGLGPASLEVYTLCGMMCIGMCVGWSVGRWVSTKYSVHRLFPKKNVTGEGVLLQGSGELLLSLKLASSLSQTDLPSSLVVSSLDSGTRRRQNTCSLRHPEGQIRT